MNHVDAGYLPDQTILSDDEWQELLDSYAQGHGMISLFSEDELLIEVGIL